MDRVITAIIFIVLGTCFQGCKNSYGHHFILTKTIVLDDEVSSGLDTNKDSLCLEIGLIKQSDSLFVYDFNILNKSEQEQWVMLFENPVFEVEINLENEFQKKIYYGGLVKKGSFVNFKKKYAVNIPIVIPTNLQTEILLKIKSKSKKTHSVRPILISMDEFMYDLRMSGLIDNLLLGILMFLVLVSVYLSFIFKERVFLYIAFNLLFITLQCANINIALDSFENTSIFFVFLSASSFYFVFLTQIILYRIIIAPAQCFPVLNVLMSFFNVVLYFLLGIQVTLTFIAPESVLQYMVYSYFPFLLILLLISVFIIVKTKFKVPGYSALLVAVGAIAAIFEVPGGFYRYIPLEFCASIAGVLLIIFQFNNSIRKKETKSEPLSGLEKSADNKLDRQVTTDRSKPLNLLENIGSEVVLLRFQDIAYLKIENKSCCIYTFKKGVILSTRSLEFYEKHFNCTFFRLNRQFLVSPSGIERITISKDYQYIVSLQCCTNNETVQLTKNKTFLFKNWLSNINSQQ